MTICVHIHTMWPLSYYTYILCTCMVIVISLYKYVHYDMSIHVCPEMYTCYYIPLVTTYMYDKSSHDNTCSFFFIISLFGHCLLMYFIVVIKCSFFTLYPLISSLMICPYLVTCNFSCLISSLYYYYHPLLFIHIRYSFSI